ncbi:septal ring lytic transglycosylase RlpA family protein [Methylomonas methanica]|uniref:Endolytic peptidoglycan transglycosylase RlpA n=1 Tax=Methylomonas methanica (strain DSM 25384 / MC09) TaxID=857087 RepID=G0A0N7_METMM|nr:septal ring lytic transglycosylase RlpA family protein [Methylomonas methanica]AEF98813.1 rare lipoprotein A [Methylomonas methanica MC09]
MTETFLGKGVSWWRVTRLPNCFLLQTLLIALLVGCASDAPIPPANVGAETPDYTNQAAYNKPYTIKGKTYYPMVSASGYRMRGVASWYGAESGNRTAMGSRFNPDLLTAAHKTLPLPCKVKVTNLKNGRSVVVTVNDRGPFHRDRLIDLSRAAAKQLEVKGTAEVEVEYVDDAGDDS